MKKYKGLLAVLALAAGSALQAQTNELVIQAGKPGAEIQPTMYGLFFEDINYAAVSFFCVSASFFGVEDIP